MRVLFVSSPGLGHLFPMVPLAWALRSAGHAVVVAAAGAAVAGAERAGLSVVDAAPGFGLDAMRAGLGSGDLERVRSLMRLPLSDLRPALPMFARVADAMVDRVVAAAVSWAPDLIVQSQVQGAGLVAAGKLGLPVVEHGFGFDRTLGMAEQLRQHMGGAFSRNGVERLPQRREVIDVAPPSLLADPPRGWSMRYLPYNGSALLPDWLAQATGRPRIAVTLGTMAPRSLGIDPVRRIVELAAGIDAEVVLALGDADASPLGRVPANVRVAGWVPLSELLPGCAALIHHGGAGTTLTALACGTPQLILPSGADRHINAAAVKRRGAGIEADPADLTPTVLQALVADERLRRNAREVRAEMATLPSPAALATRLEAAAAPAPG